MNIFIQFALALLFGAIYIIIYFLDVRIKKTNVYATLFSSKQTDFIIDGIIYGSLFLVFSAITNSFYFSKYMYVFASTILLLTKGYQSSLIGLLISFIFIVLVKENTFVHYYNFAILGSLYITYIYTNEFLSFKKSRLVTLIIYITMVMVMMIIYGTIQTSLYESFDNIFIIPFVSITTYLIISYIISTGESASILSTTIRYDFSNYYRNTRRILEIHNFIRENKISYGLYGLLKIDILGNHNSQEQDEVEETILLDFEKLVSSKSVLFKSNNYYGFFLPLNEKIHLSNSINGNGLLLRPQQDYLSELQDILFQLPTKYKASSGNIFKVNVKVGSSLYGIQDSSIKELDMMSEYVIRASSSKYSNIISLFNPKDHIKRVRDTNKLFSLNEQIGLDNFHVNFEKIEKNTYMIFQESSNDISIFDLQKLKKQNKISDIFDRYFAGLAMQSLPDKNAKYILRYSPEIISKKMIFPEFLTLLSDSEIKLQNLFLLFDLEELKKNINNKIFNNNIEKLKSYGIKFAVDILENKTRFKSKQFMPNLQLRFLVKDNELKTLVITTKL